MHEERKEEFIHSLHLNSSGEAPVYAMFRQLAQCEEQQQIDVCEFDVSSLSYAFSTLGWHNSSTFTVYRNWLRQYTNWCIGRGYCDQTNAAEHFTREHLALSPIRNQMYINTESFLKTMDDIYHYEPGAEKKISDDRYLMQEVLWHLAWLGFSREEALVVRKDQVDLENKQIITDTWKPAIPHEFVSLFKRAIEIQVAEYYVESSKGTRFVRREFSSNEYLIRPLKRKAQDEGLPTKIHTIDVWTQKAHHLQQENCPPMSSSSMKRINFQTFHTCGRYVALKKWEEEHEEATIDNGMKWCELVRRKDLRTNAPKKSLTVFLASYKAWKNAFYPVFY